MKSPYFSEEHEAFREAVRKFMENEIAPHAAEWEKRSSSAAGTLGLEEAG